MKKLRLSSLLLIFLSGCFHAAPPALFVAGVDNPVVSLNGQWEINTDTEGEFWLPDSTAGNWQPIRVPGEPMMQGFAIRHDEPFACRKWIAIPQDYADKKVQLRFDGVYNYARLWVNGQFVREHYGGFTRWESDITPFVTPGEEALVTLEITDRADGISYGSGYAKHPIGGILRDVSLRALPKVYPREICIVTNLDENYKHADLVVSGTISSRPVRGRIGISITDPYNTKIPLQQKEIIIEDTGTFTIRNVMRSPHKWDAEHPRLYTLTLTYFEDGQPVYRNDHKVGFRKVEINGNRMLVNGKEIKLRGANRHDIHPLLGRVSTPEYERRDVRLAKEANMNFIRTSHYPPTENFLTLCDEYGIYVEDESAVCFVGSHRTAAYYPGASESDTAFTGRYLSQLREMVVNHRNHPSVILWSIGNENSFGSNFKLSYDWVKATDTTRPVIFSYPGHVPDNVKAYEVLSMHYPGIDGNMNQIGKITRDFGHPDLPAIFDEWAHVACYNNFTIKEDPNIRDFWGRSLDSMWTRVYEADGGLGGAIWGMIDETFMLPDTLPGFNNWWGIVDPHVIPAEYSGHTVGYGEWGIVDTWRRKKPEFWNTKKAYSPFKIVKTRFSPEEANGPLNVPVYNRFDHTNLSELKIKYRYRGKNHLADKINLGPHQKGTLVLHSGKWLPGEPIYLEARDGNGRIIDQYTLRIDEEKMETGPPETNSSLAVTGSDSTLTVGCNNNISLVFDKTTGQLRSIMNKWDKMNLSGPFFNLRSRGRSVIYSYHEIREYKGWKLLGFSWEESAGRVIIHSTGLCADSIEVDLMTTIMADAGMTIRYSASGIPAGYIRELGIGFNLENAIDAISWKRDPYWSYYPEEHLSSAEGTSALYPTKLKSYRSTPPKDWAFDTKSFYYDGTVDEDADNRLVNRAKGTKENIREYSLLKDGSKVLTVTSDGQAHCRLSKTGDTLRLFISSEMDYVDLSWGNYQRNIAAESEYAGELSVKIFDKR